MNVRLSRPEWGISFIRSHLNLKISCNEKRVDIWCCGVYRDRMIETVKRFTREVAAVQQFVRSVAALACDDFEQNHPVRTGTDICNHVGVPHTQDLSDEKLENFQRVGKALYRHARSARHKVQTDVIVKVFTEMGDVLTNDLADTILYNAVPTLREISAESQFWYRTLYRNMRELADLPVYELTIETRRLASRDNLAAQLEAQKILHPNIVGCSIAHDSPWVTQQTEIKLVCEHGHDIWMRPQYIRERLDKKVEQTLCQTCQPRKTVKALRGRERGFRHKSGDIFECQTCGSDQQIYAPSLQGQSRCKGCAEDGMENETVWVALDKEPFAHAFVWVGRMPAFIHDIQDQLDIEPVWAEVTNLHPPSFFRTDEKRRGPVKFDGEFHPIGRLDVTGIEWIDINVSDTMARALTVKSRTVRGTWVMPRAIDYIAGRSPRSRYAGNGFLPLNTFHNAEFLGWDRGTPQYEFEVEDSPLAKAMRIV